MPSAKEALQASYDGLCLYLARITADPQPSYSEKGRSVSWDEHRTSVVDQIDKLKKQLQGRKPFFRRSRHRG